jgi:transposase-like protein
MKEKRNFTPEFKRQVIEELLSGVSRPAQICRRHNIGISLLYHWKKQYSLGKLNNEPIKEAALQDRVEQLERLVGKLTLENEFLKKALQNNVNHHSRKENSSNGTSSKQLPGDASL